MRTTLTLDDDVARLIDEAAHRERRPVKQIVNEALRRALDRSGDAPPYVLVPHEATLRPGFDPARMNALTDELEDEALTAQWTADR